MRKDKIVVTVEGKDLVELARILTDGNKDGALQFLKRVFQVELGRIDSG